MFVQRAPYDPMKYLKLTKEEKIKDIMRKLCDNGRQRRKLKLQLHEARNE